MRRGFGTSPTILIAQAVLLVIYLRNAWMLWRYPAEDRLWPRAWGKTKEGRATAAKWTATLVCLWLVAVLVLGVYSGSNALVSFVGAPILIGLAFYAFEKR